MGKQSVEPGQSDFMAQESEQKEWNWRAGATAVICREDQQPAGGNLEEGRLGAVLHRSIVSLTAATTDWIVRTSAAREAGRDERDAGQLASCGAVGWITGELTCSKTQRECRPVVGAPACWRQGCRYSWIRSNSWGSRRCTRPRAAR
jgi:hypothetical protein